LARAGQEKVIGKRSRPIDNGSNEINDHIKTNLFGAVTRIQTSEINGGLNLEATSRVQDCQISASLSLTFGIHPALNVRRHQNVGEYNSSANNASLVRPSVRALSR
jgi:hypothetical protein